MIGNYEDPRKVFGKAVGDLAMDDDRIVLLSADSGKSSGFGDFMKAHPERYFCVQEHPVLVYEWLRLGCLAQVNKGSLFGKFGRRAARAADVLVHNRLATCVANDAHSPYTRTTYMKDAWEYLSDRFGEREAHRLLEENPARILRGQRVPPHGTPPEQRRKIFF